MTRGRVPRKPRPVHANTLGRVLARTALLSATEVRETIAPARAVFERLQRGMATEDQHTVLATSIALMAEIERGGIVRGLHGHIATAQAAMASIRTRALVGGAWRQTPLYFHELDALREALDLHEFQLRQLSAGELTAAAKKLIARTRSSGGVVARTSAQQLGLAVVEACACPAAHGRRKS